jgi:rare lipoprotein A
MRTYSLCFILILFMFCGAQPVADKKYCEEGYASFYSDDFDGKLTANGERFNRTDYTAAHLSLPFGTYLRVTNLNNNYTVVVRVNDRGPYLQKRIIDLSEGAARKIGGYMHGVTRVRLEQIDLLQLTPELENIFNGYRVVDCLGNVDSLAGLSLSLWSSTDLVHALYVANDLYLKEDVNKVFIVTKKTGDLKRYHVVISCIENHTLQNELKDYFEQQGFMVVRGIK